MFRPLHTDKTFGKMSNGPASVSRVRQSALELKESWEDLEKERAHIPLETVEDTSFEAQGHSSGNLTVTKDISAVQEAEPSKGDTTADSDRMRRWIEGIEREDSSTVNGFASI